jgi:signal-transduction protein with cAMP-binding, CBS, and nucleotidyltransferase domain
MICPRCLYDNIPGVDNCAWCVFDLAPLDVPVGQDRVERLLLDDQVADLAPREPVMVPTDTEVGTAIGTLIDEEVGAVLVVDPAGLLVGILSERDLLTRMDDPPDRSVCVQRVMTPNPETVTLIDTLAFALFKMDTGGYRHLPVVEAGRPVGMISVRDLMRHVTRLCRE